MDGILEQVTWFPTVCRLYCKSLYHDSTPITTLYCHGDISHLLHCTGRAHRSLCTENIRGGREGERDVFYQVCFQPDQCSELILEPHRSCQQKCKRGDCCSLLETDLLPTCSPCEVSMELAAAITGREVGGVEICIDDKTQHEQF